MEAGKLLGIYIARRRAEPLDSIAEVRVIAGKGLEDDRYFARRGTYSKKEGSGRHVTLIEVEALAAILREHRIRLEPNETRRNLLTEGVALNHLVGRDFAVGEVILRGTRLCEPCGHLESLTRAGVRAALVHRGGLRADIVRAGSLRVGDAIRPV